MTVRRAMASKGVMALSTGAPPTYVGLDEREVSRSCDHGFGKAATS